ncbi:MAG: bacillithiol transferase BstA [Acidobacteriia bacterium]|nr:bacillithiol transferase BstA [Terriglobia bacterium]
MDLRYPVGPCEYPETVSPETRKQHIEELAAAPARFREAVRGLTDSQLDTPYRPGGWTVRQVLHHVADSHINSYVRFRLALTEDEPTIKPYDEKKWSELADVAALPAEVSLQLLDSLHRRWVVLLVSLSDADFGRPFRHPEIGPVRLDTYLAACAWHCRHHAAHITALRHRQNWK